MLASLPELVASRPEAPFVLAVSGGLDSVVLLDLAAAAYPKERLTVAHFDHRCRPESAEDWAFVEGLARRAGLRCIAAASRESGPRSEARLREERLAFLESVDETAWILTAHHADDQLETFLMRLLRGTGLRGLSGIPPRRGRFVRPLLRIPRCELARHAALRGLEFREDPSNRASDYLRNRVRHGVVPELKALAADHGGEAALLARVAALCEEIRQTEQSRLDALEARLGGKWIRSGSGASILAKDFEALSPSDRASLIKTVAPSDGATRERVHALIDALTQGHRGGELAGGVRVRRSKGFLHFSKSCR